MTTALQRREAWRRHAVEEALQYRSMADTYDSINNFEFTNGGVIYDQYDIPSDDPSDELFTATYNHDPVRMKKVDRILKANQERKELADTVTAQYSEIPHLMNQTELEDIICEVKHEARMGQMLTDDVINKFEKPSQKQILLMTPAEERLFKQKLKEAAAKTVTLPVETLPQLRNTISSRRRPREPVQSWHKPPAQPSGFSTIDPFLVVPKELEKEFTMGAVQTQPFRGGTDYSYTFGTINHRAGVGKDVLQKYTRHEREYESQVQHDAQAEIAALKQRTRDAYEQSRRQISLQRERGPKVSGCTTGCIDPRDVYRLDANVEKLNQRGSLIRGYDALFRHS
ncbi:hypothetical protein GMRT_14128 [Giardia muris]|uniref:Uncharacterized protein n=1 Tax=Giardia muris TaxID=5742 RepID=A0A4Z1T5E8_GIAMU|nr:hypothetical protein GMRT_14128 [Giardia muris]|eukprot:TNJ28337.1 hypothetical protein GMRT_14128 [Giardia muris]